MPTFDLAVTLDLPNLPSILKKIDRQLLDAIGSADKSLRDPMSGVVSTKSKRLRPALLIASIPGSRLDDAAIHGSCAIEFIHLGSLIHDDIIDHAPNRWGKPTIHISHGLPTAILAGDFLFAQAGAQAAKVSLVATELVAKTIANLLQGENLETIQDHDISRSLKSYYKCISLKTASLISAACQLGGLSANLSPAKIKALSDYGYNLGMSFQITDDLLDLLSTEELMGKPVGNDAAQGTYTLPVIFGLKSKKSKIIHKLLVSASNPSEKLAKILIDDGSVNKTIKSIGEFNQKAIASLTVFPASQSAGLARLPDAYLNWALSNQVSPAYKI